VLGVRFFGVLFVILELMLAVAFGRVIVLQRLVQVGVQLAGFGGVVGGVDGVARGDLGVMAGQLDVAVGVVLSRFAMVARGVLVVFGCGVVVFVDGFAGGFD
jgi:hypothetical protein